MSNDTTANPDPETESETAGSPEAPKPGKLSPDELPDGSGNDAKKSYEPDDGERYDAG